MAGNQRARRSIRASVLVGVGFLVVWQVAHVLSLPRETTVTLAIYGFVFHVIFGKAYALIPSYFERQLISPWGPRIQLPLTSVGTVLLAHGTLFGSMTGQVGALLWVAGAISFLLTIFLTLGKNLFGSQTGTGDANSHRQRIDRIANAFVPIALLYFLFGTYNTISVEYLLPSIFGNLRLQTIHLLAAGMATLLIFIMSSRLLPRFFATSAANLPIYIMLPAAAIAPALLVTGFVRPAFIHIGGFLLWIGFLAYAIHIAVLYHRSNRRRIGLLIVGFGGLSGVVGASVGLLIITSHLSLPLVEIHYRVMLLGFLGLTIIGFLCQFYPPGISTLPGISDRGAMVAAGVILVGLVLESGGLIFDELLLSTSGQFLAILGCGWVAWTMFGLTYEHGF